MKAKEYLKTLGLVIVTFPLVVVASCLTWTGCIIKSAGFLAMLDIDSANNELKSFIDN
ncbi:hypothetical protein Prede_2601 [Prevotella dentalis DSM 3688]|uniref:Uncharacterized protein n=1 Tax=Prevotella dentalis (strain ATCC 49559 / DSM 3688 / JCM 13448 / NCTC 12043 / ES 2772) TaxID=908937 RepID=F9D7A4_PREDD|nr:hypothetical protein [Prevotella dentalis]AGB29734.1 hypothetical protein Prede_2488 [Prevotella dentalis DSM 3688]AGB29835.1 hypothetical protein Prede_2601 [Prevotella dentalis DSM 3688]EGQ11470.1 hypothetical protein HMPREF9136_2732 [Prevotella dentalis DSM 3688]